MALVTDVHSYLINGGSTEVLNCKATAGETYATKFSKIVCVKAQSRSRAGVYCTVSGSIVTIQGASVSDDIVDMIIIGEK